MIGRLGEWMQHHPKVNVWLNFLLGYAGCAVLWLMVLGTLAGLVNLVYMVWLIV